MECMKTVHAHLECDAALGRFLLEVKLACLDDEMLSLLGPFSNVLLEYETLILDHCKWICVALLGW